MGYTTSHKQVGRYLMFLAALRMSLRSDIRSEYVTIVAIMICMSLWDFVTGVLFGIVLACK